MKHRLYHLVVFTVTLAMLFCTALAASPFPDVDENAEYAEAVEYLKGIGLFQGDAAGNFNPDGLVSRAEMAMIICRMLGETENLTVSNKFSDVAADNWANPYITRASELGLVDGYGNGKFGPADKITYEQAVTLIIQSVGLNDSAVAAGGYPNGYIFVADDYGYTEGLHIPQKELLKRWQIAILLYNSMA